MIPSRPDGNNNDNNRRAPRTRLLIVLNVVVACVAIIAAVVFLFVSSPDTTSGPGSGSTTHVPNVDQTIAQLVSVFENGTPEIQYAYVKDLDDGRGYTAGRAGFCTGCGDLLTVVKDYTARVPTNPLAPYLPTLTRLAASSSDSTDGLDGFQEAWRTAAEDPAFRQLQDQVTDALYVAPARRLAEDNGVRAPLGLAILVDTAVQQGTGKDPDGLPAMVEKTNAAAGGAPADGVDETTWLRDFLGIRRATLQNPSSSDTGAVWSESVGRVDALEALLDAGNLDLQTPFTINPWGDPQTIN